MKKMIKGLAVALSAFLTMSMVVGCTNQNESGSVPSTGTVEENGYNGTHILTATDTDKYLVQNGKCNYVLVVPAEESDLIREAKNEFVYFFKKATGITLKTVKDTGLTHNASNRYISLGNTTLFRSTGIEVDKKELDIDGVRIVTKDNSIYLVGAHDQGALNSVYTFFEITFGLEVYSYDCIEIEENVTNKKLKNYDVTDVPDLKLREINYEYVRTPFSDDYDVMQLASRLRFTRDFYGSCYGSYLNYDDTNDEHRMGHNTTDFVLPKSQYQAIHPDWYSDQGDQLCYTAHGDAGEYQAMLDEMLKKMAYTIDRYYKDGVDLGQMIGYNIFMMDNYEVCICEACSKNSIEYGCHTASVIMFMNDIAEMFEEWAQQPENEKYQAKDIVINMLAYQDYAEAPVKYDETTGEYVPIDEKVRMRDNVGIYLADIHIDFQQSFDAEEHDRTKKIIGGWSNITKHIQHWVYPVNYRYYMYMYDPFSMFSGDTLAYYATRGDGMYMETMGNSSVLTLWRGLQFWYSSKLMWNTSLDEGELMNRWFNAMFKDAAPIMKSLFMDMRTHAATVYAENGLYCQKSCMNKLEVKDYWPIGTLKQWIQKCDDAILAIEEYKMSNASLYQALKNHIDTESISPIYAYLRLYGSEISSVEKTMLCNRILEMQENLPMHRLEIAQGAASTSLIDYIKSIV